MLWFPATGAILAIAGLAISTVADSDTRLHIALFRKNFPELKAKAARMEVWDTVGQWMSWIGFIMLFAGTCALF